VARHYDHFGELLPKLFFLRRLSEKWTLYQWSFIKLRLTRLGLLWAGPAKLPLVLVCTCRSVFFLTCLKQAKNRFSDFLVIIIHLITIKIADFTLFMPLSNKIVRVKTINSCQGNFRHFSDWKPWDDGAWDGFNTMYKFYKQNECKKYCNWICFPLKQVT
jgi:hypothetical protein